MKALGAATDDTNPRAQKHHQPATDIASDANGATAGTAGATGRIHVWGVGKAVAKTVSVAEILKQKVPGLKQVTEISQVQVDDTFVAKEGKVGRDGIVVSLVLCLYSTALWRNADIGTLRHGACAYGYCASCSTSPCF